MKVAHLVKVTPGHICGLYQTTVDLVAALRELGVDSRLTDTDPGQNEVFPHGKKEDRGCPIETGLEFCREADILVSHSGYGDDVGRLGKPIIYCAHGRPSISYHAERTGGLPLYSYFYRQDSDPKWKAVVTFWKEHVPYLEVMFRKVPVHWVPSCVDLNYWSPGPDEYDFGGKRGKINVVISDSWREDIDPWPTLHAFALWARRQDGVKLHLYGMPKNHKGAWPIIKRLEADGTMGEYRPVHHDLRSVYRSADFVLTPHTIDVRTVREAMACGCPVVRVDQGLTFGYPIKDREVTRIEAQLRFGAGGSATAFKRILDAS